MRLDKLLGNLGYGTRTEIKKLCKQGAVVVNGKEMTKSSDHVDPEKDEIYFNGKKVNYREFIYIMLNKPAGYISATFDKNEQTVLDLIDEEYLAFEPFPVGRLDKDTEGLLILTNDGKLSHRVLSPKKHVPKKYFAIIKGTVTEKDIEIFKEGVDIGEGYTTKPAELEILSTMEIEELIEKLELDVNELKETIEYSGEGISEINVTISEGKFHQVKRMFNAVGKEVIFLKRTQMGALKLDENLEIGEYRELTEEEIQLLEKRD